MIIQHAMVQEVSIFLYKNDQKFIDILCFNIYHSQILTSAHNKAVNLVIIVIWTRCVKIRLDHMCAIACLGFVVSINSIVPRSMNALPIYTHAMKMPNVSIRSGHICAAAKMAMKVMAYNVNVSVLRSADAPFYFSNAHFNAKFQCFTFTFTFTPFVLSIPHDRSGVQANVFEWWCLYFARHMYLPYGLYWCLMWTGFGRVCNWFARMQIVCLLCKYARLVLLQMPARLWNA